MTQFKFWVNYPFKCDCTQAVSRTHSQQRSLWGPSNVWRGYYLHFCHVDMDFTQVIQNWNKH